MNNEGAAPLYAAVTESWQKIFVTALPGLTGQGYRR